MRIAVIGAGNVGSVLAHRWRKAGHDVVLGVRDPAGDKYATLRETGLDLKSPREAAENAEVITLATPWSAAADAIAACGDVAGKVVIDCTNPLKPGLTGLTHTGNDSGAEQVARWADGALVAKAFNTVGANIMDDPRLEGRRAVMFVCGEEEAKEAARELSNALGFETIDAGPIENARLLEPFALLWITAALQFGLGREFAFSLIRKQVAN